MAQWTLAFTFVALASVLPGTASAGSRKIIIVKADDLAGITPAWNRFFNLSREKGVKVSAGIIANTLEGEKSEYVGWLKKIQATGQVEFWNHGWDHRRWTTSERGELSEFGGSGYEHQKQHFGLARQIMSDLLGSVPIAFGTPYNAIDADTVKVIDEDADLRLFFCRREEGRTRKLLAPIVLNVEGDGTGKPNFEKFKAGYAQERGLAFSAIQFHPNSFTDAHVAEYGRILDFLIAEGWTFLLPSEYVALAQPSEPRV